MNPDASDLWQRSQRAMQTARQWVGIDPDAAASRAYYAAFYAVSALFAIENRGFVKHTAVEAAVHRDLVKAGRMAVAVGQAYSSLASLRQTADYGGAQHINIDSARAAVDFAQMVVDAVRAASTEPLP